MMTLLALGIAAGWMLLIAFIICLPLIIVGVFVKGFGKTTQSTPDIKGEMVRAQYEYDRTLRRRD